MGAISCDYWWLTGTRWQGKCWHFHNMVKYEFDVHFEVRRRSFGFSVTSMACRFRCHTRQPHSRLSFQNSTERPSRCTGPKRAPPPVIVSELCEPGVGKYVSPHISSHSGPKMSHISELHMHWHSGYVCRTPAPGLVTRVVCSWAHGWRLKSHTLLTLVSSLLRNQQKGKSDESRP